MAPKSGMSNFVQGRHAAQQDGRPDSPAGNPELESLKLQVPNASNSSVPRQKADKRKSGRESAEGKKSRSKPREHSQPKNVLYDTDTASLDDTSTTISEQQARHPGHAQRQSRQSNATHQPRSQQLAAGRNGYANTLGDDSGDELQDDPLQNDTQTPGQFNQWLAQANAQSSKHRITDTYIKGDSYPATTSGNPSVVDGGGQTETGVPDQPQVTPAQSKAPAFITRGGGGQRQQLPQRGNASTGRHQASIAVTQDQSAGRPKKAQAPIRAASPQSEAFEYEGSEDFAFAAPAPQQQSRKVAATSQQGAHKAQASMTKTETNDAAATGYPPRPLQRPMPRPTVAVKGPPQQGQQSGRHGQVTTHIPSPQADVVSGEPGQEEQLNAESAYPQSGFNGGQTEPYVQSEGQEQKTDEAELDYPVEDIVNMSYDALKNQSFDKAPGVEPFAFSELPEDADLSKQIVAAFDMHNYIAQADFFASLGIEDWETAGDWFLDRFGEVIGKLREARNERRQAARDFEAEIEQRSLAIDKKRKLTDAVLDEMKSSGAAVLTPKRTKKSK